jgi:hypothetical protein
VHQRGRSKTNPSQQTFIYRTEMKPGKHFCARMKPLPLPLANGHGSCMTAAPERALLLSVGEWPLNVAWPLQIYGCFTSGTRNGYVTAASLLIVKPPCGGFRSDTVPAARQSGLGLRLASQGPPALHFDFGGLSPDLGVRWVRSGFP